MCDLSATEIDSESRYIQAKDIHTSMVWVVGTRYVNMPVLKSDFSPPIDSIRLAFSTFSLITGSLIDPI